MTLIEKFRKMPYVRAVPGAFLLFASGCTYQKPATESHDTLPVAEVYDALGNRVDPLGGVPEGMYYVRGEDGAATRCVLGDVSPPLLMETCLSSLELAQK